MIIFITVEAKMIIITVFANLSPNTNVHVHVLRNEKACFFVAAIDGLRTLDSVIDAPHSLVVVLGFLAAIQWTTIFIIPIVQVSGV